VFRGEIARIIETENAYGYYAHDRAVELADKILDIPIDDVVTIGDVLQMWTNGDRGRELHPGWNPHPR